MGSRGLDSTPRFPTQQLSTIILCYLKSHQNVGPQVIVLWNHIFDITNDHINDALNDFISEESIELSVNDLLLWNHILDIANDLINDSLDDIITEKSIEIISVNGLPLWNLVL